MFFGNVGWISYFVVLGKCFTERPEFREYRGLIATVIFAIVPYAMIAGVAANIAYLYSACRQRLCAAFTGLCFKSYKQIPPS